MPDQLGNHLTMQAFSWQGKGIRPIAERTAKHFVSDVQVPVSHEPVPGGPGHPDFRIPYIRFAAFGMTQLAHIRTIYGRGAVGTHDASKKGSAPLEALPFVLSFV